MNAFFGTPSKTHPGRKNYTTKKGDNVYHRKGHYIRKTHRPYSFHKGSRSKLIREEKILLLKRGIRFIIVKDTMCVNHADHIIKNSYIIFK